MSSNVVNLSRKDKAPAIFILLLLVFVIFAHTGESIQSQLLNLGSYVWEDYVILRGDIPTPNCNPNIDIEKKLNRLEAESAAEEDDLFANAFNRSSTKQSIVKQMSLCQKKHDLADRNHTKVTTPVIAYRSVETLFTRIALFAVEQERIVLMLLLFVASMVATIRQHHISFRPIASVFDHKFSTSIQLIGNTVLLYSSWAYRENILASGIAETHPEMIIILLLGFGTLAAVNTYQLIKPPQGLTESRSLLHAFLTIPIYTHFALGTGYYFTVSEGHTAGIAILFSQMFELAGLFLNIGLYIWVGMLLKETRLGERIFDLFTPWKLPPELLAFAAIVIMAVPTAYTGASGIIIIAMGTVVYAELRRVGARRQLALAATAMTGSSGVVLQPCLLVVAIAMLNKEVVTDDLFGWGIKVFLLTITIFFIITMITKKDPIKVARPSEAMAPTIEAFKKLLPYILILAGVALFYALLLNAYLDQFSAPIILPVLVFSIVVYERTLDKHPEDCNENERDNTVQRALVSSIHGASVHIGAILMVMACGFAVGGIIQRSGLFDSLPETFSSIWVAMSFLLALLVFIGMIMDAFGALILVSSTIAAIAYKNGIHPVHFWMVTLVAFELGYLSPPVSLNHLLTRQVVGEQEAAAAALEGDTFWYRHEKILLPLVVMGITLLIVAFGPLIVGYNV